MALLWISGTDDPGDWRAMLQAVFPDLEFRVWPATGDPDDIDVALVWKPPPGLLKHLPNLRLIASLGMGVDHIFSDPELPPAVPVTRIVDNDMAAQMAQYMVHGALDHIRSMEHYRRAQARGEWSPLPLADTALIPVGILGLGVLGQAAAHAFRALGFPVRAWTRRARTLDGVEVFSGPTAFGPFLADTRVLVCLLPLTGDTRGILCGDTFSQLPQGAFLINAARGDHLVETDLLWALDRGHLAGAQLDVFAHEPLAAGHPFWKHPRVRVTPHVAALTNPRTAAAQVIDNIRRLRAGEPLLHVVDPQRGY